MVSALAVIVVQTGHDCGSESVRQGRVFLKETLINTGGLIWNSGNQEKPSRIADFIGSTRSFSRVPEFQINYSAHP
jgi:hypothetical protein